MSFQQVILKGNLGADPEVRYTAEQKCVTTINVATSKKWKNREGQQQESTEWHRVVFWEKRAEAVGKYFAKGQQIMVVGELKTRKWEDKNGVTRYTTEIIGQEFDFCGSAKAENSARTDPSPSTGEYPPELDEIPF